MSSVTESNGRVHFPLTRGRRSSSSSVAARRGPPQRLAPAGQLPIPWAELVAAGGVRASVLPLSHFPSPPRPSWQPDQQPTMFGVGGVGPCEAGWELAPRRGGPSAGFTGGEVIRLHGHMCKVFSRTNHRSCGIEIAGWLGFQVGRDRGRVGELAGAAGGTPPTHRRWRDGRATRRASRRASSQPRPPPRGAAN